MKCQAGWITTYTQDCWEKYQQLQICRWYHSNGRKQRGTKKPFACLIVQSCPTLCGSMDCSLPGSSVHGILQARILGWVAVPFSRGSSPPRVRTCVSCSGRWVLTTESPGKPPKNHSMRVQEESEKASLKLNIHKTQIMAPSPVTSW